MDCGIWDWIIFILNESKWHFYHMQAIITCGLLKTIFLFWLGFFGKLCSYVWLVLFQGRRLDGLWTDGKRHKLQGVWLGQYYVIRFVIMTSLGSSCLNQPKQRQISHAFNPSRWTDEMNCNGAYETHCCLIAVQYSAPALLYLIIEQTTLHSPPIMYTIGICIHS